MNKDTYEKAMSVLEKLRKTINEAADSIESKKAKKAA